MTDSQDVIKIILVDDHAVLRSGLKYITEVIDSIEVIGEASNGLEAIQLYHQLQPDVVLMDLMMPVMGGIEAPQGLQEYWARAGRFSPIRVACSKA